MIGHAERILAGLLRYGALVAAGWMAAGLLLTLRPGGQIAKLHPTLRLNEIFSQVMIFDPVAFIVVGVLLLLLLPVLRVAITVVIFASNGDYRFMIISAVVLLIIIGGFFAEARLS